MNSTQIVSGCTKESDGIGGVQHYCNGGTKKVTLKSSKFWVYGVTNTHLGELSFSYGDVHETFNQNNLREKSNSILHFLKNRCFSKNLFYSQKSHPINS